MDKIPQKTPENTNSTPLLSQNLTDIKGQVAQWDETYGPGKVSQYLFDIAFNQLREAKGFKFSNRLLTETRRSLKRAEGSKSLGRSRHRKRPQQHSSEVAR